MVVKTGALVPVEEYLRTTYDPDRDYVDGEVIERNLGERDHSTLQGEFLYFFRQRDHEWLAYAYVEQRVQVSAKRVRVPDVCVVVGKMPTEQIFREPPFICIEVLSKDDSLEGIQEKIDDYLAFGVRYVWVINPRTRRAWVYTREGIHEAVDGVLVTRDPELSVPLAEVFARLDQ